MGKILLTPAILGEKFGVVVLAHADFYATKLGLDKEKVSKDLHGGLVGQDYADMFHGYFGDELILRLF